MTLANTSNAPLHLRLDGLETALRKLFDNFENAYAAGRFESSGPSMSCRTNFPKYDQILKKALASEQRTTGDKCRVLVAQTGNLGLPDLRWGEHYFQEREVEAQLSGTRFRLHYMDDIGFWQVFDRQHRTGLQLMQSPDGYPDWDPGSPLRNFMHWNLVGKDQGLVHAGTLAIGGTGFMFAGPGGSGKSATVLAGIADGMKSVGDDYVLARIEDGCVNASALFTTLKQDPEGMQRLALNQDNSISSGVNWQGKHQFTLADVNPTSGVADIQVHALFLPHVTGNNTTVIRPAGAKEAFLALAPSGVSQIPGDRDASFAICAKLARDLPCYHIELGVDPKELIGALRSFVDKELL
ncbi:MAG: hypothetical protein KUG58_10605 [Marinosulfonomonas sp.]|nr:hypothetical protein [Marinosulfonomonas sp.]